ncbi:unnamed protein product [Cuscuta campestris]|uniref:Peptidase C14 caspase domain-containing protein n=1 Tax=Cuscuta campestris TaxID=132261 RepID=A0A484LZK8_9ASTE|nr:unnamed protein product [Cuscuta campestris]
MEACRRCEKELVGPHHGGGGPYCRKCQSSISLLGDAQGQAGSTSSGRRKFGSILRKKSSSAGSPRAFWPSFRPGISISIEDGSPSGKRALLCGVTYQKERFKLRGTLQDVKNMRDLLVERFGFQPPSILILAEEELYRAPTRKNILEGFKWLMRNLRTGDSLVFYFSGHGLRQPELEGDEIDGFDETICPLDFKSEGMIPDNAINDIIVKPLREGTKLHAIVDACHSGTILDLPRIYNRKEKRWTNNEPPSRTYKGTNGGKAICFSACEDHQLAADTSAFSAGKDMNGAMTYTFIKAIKENPNITYSGLMNYMHQSIKSANVGIGCLPSINPFYRKLVQDPVLSTSRDFDINQKLNL